jgi:hypothetical protein
VSDPTELGDAEDLITVLILGVDYNPGNDHLNKATTLKLGSGAAATAQAVLAGSSVDVWEPVDNNLNSSAVRTGSVWYKWTAPQDGVADFSVCGTDDVGPAIAVFGSFYHPVGYGELASLGFDQGQPCGFLGVGGTVSVTVQQGSVYYVQVSKTAGSFIAQSATVRIEATFSEPYIEKLSKTSGKSGSTITITGQALNANGTPVVKFGSKVATIVGEVGPNSLTVKVPSNSKGGKKVTVTSGVTVSNTVTFTYK